MNKQDNKKRILDLKDIGYVDLLGNFQKINFSQQDFANALFQNARSIDMDDFARSIHKEGKAEINDQVIAEITELAPKLWIHRVASALIETISKL